MKRYGVRDEPNQTCTAVAAAAFIAGAIAFASGPALPGCGSAPTESNSDNSGDMYALIGGVWPEESNDKFADPGLYISFRGAATHLPFLSGLTPLFGLTGALFLGDERQIEVETPSGTLPAVEAEGLGFGSANLGVQLGSPSRHSFFRPRVGVAPGWYFLIHEVEQTIPPDSIPIYRKTLNLGRFGWKGIVGSDFMLAPKWGIAIEFVYDQIWSLEDDFSDRYLGLVVGVVFPNWQEGDEILPGVGGVDSQNRERAENASLLR